MYVEKMAYFIFECVVHITNNLLSFVKAGNVLQYFLQLIMQLCMVVSLFSSDTSKPYFLGQESMLLLKLWSLK